MSCTDQQNGENWGDRELHWNRTLRKDWLRLTEGRDSSKGEDSAEETEAKPAVVAPPPVVEAVSTPSAAFPSDPTTEVSTGWVL